MLLAVEHRHLNHSEYTMAAIDSVIERGQPFPDWRELCRAALDNAFILGKLERVSRWRSDLEDKDPENFSRHLYRRWLRWCEKQRLETLRPHYEGVMDREDEILGRCVAVVTGDAEAMARDAQEAQVMDLAGHVLRSRMLTPAQWDQIGRLVTAAETYFTQHPGERLPDPAEVVRRRWVVSLAHLKTKLMERLGWPESKLQGAGLTPKGISRYANKHELLDRKSLLRHRLIAQKLRENPALLERVQDNMRGWSETISPSSRPYLDAWRKLLDESLEAALAIASEDTEWATAMRQSSPFSGVLTEKEKLDFDRWWHQSRWWAE